jgi:hypothetical protein
MSTAVATALVFDEKPHTYHVDGERYISVTEALRETGAVDFSGVPPYILAAAQLRGTVVHQAVHYWNENDLDVQQFAADCPEYLGYLESWMGLVESGRLRSLLCEHRVASRRHRFAGTIDWLGEFDGDAALLDFATGDPDDCAKHWQTAAYVVAAQEWAQEPAEDRLRAFVQSHPFIARYSIRLKKSGALPSVQRYTDPRHTSEFLTLLSAHRLVANRRRPSANTFTE